MKKSILNIVAPNLRLFDGEGGGDGAAAAVSAVGNPQESQRTAVGNQAQGTPGAESADSTAQTPEQKRESDRERRKRYKEVIGGEFKDLYTEDTQRIINRKVAELAPYREKADKYQGIMDTLAYRYGIEDGDADKIRKALDGDIAIWEELADKEGISVDAYIDRRNTAIENKQLRAALERRQAEENAAKQMAAWNAEAAQLRQKYPDLDLQIEAQNPDFIKMLKAQVPMEMAYNAIHHNDIMSGAIQQAATITEQRVVSGIRAKGQRPSEAGLGANTGVVGRTEASKLTRQDRAEIARRAMRGETITF